MADAIPAADAHGWRHENQMDLTKKIGPTSPESRSAIFLDGLLLARLLANRPDSILGDKLQERVTWRPHQFEIRI